MKKRIFSSQLAEAIAQPGWVGAGPAGISYRQMAVDESDSEDKGYVLWKSWQETYLGMVDSRYLAELTIDKCVKIAQKRPENTIVALYAGAQAGMREKPGKSLRFIFWVHSKAGVSARR